MKDAETTTVRELGPDHVANDIYSFLNRKPCARHQRSDATKHTCGWPRARLPSPPAEEEGPEKLELLADASRRFSLESVKTIVGPGVLQYLQRGGFSSGDLVKTLQLFFSHSSLTEEQLAMRLQRANLRSLNAFMETLETGVYPAKCFLLGPRYIPSETEQSTAVADTRETTTGKTTEERTRLDGGNSASTIVPPQSTETELANERDNGQTKSVPVVIGETVKTGSTRANPTKPSSANVAIPPHNAPQLTTYKRSFPPLSPLAKRQCMDVPS
ncbi:YALI0A12221p [Yarrowia lipolytica CLIB122]|uniref:YALI0A12221p n=1 Tax=Yarrowia lipolytica (strain CLIB 122 / E 150) TaxID=284591 RepID=Q6CH54_YARLI|nr:YALI0A12221p [Yarrowia lipolytica CLIB122]CAG83937.1 YALI0A12221p [Yarrowia lipolytica CLIB122]|eukprot:XP_500008.1 YALI0A12221p [Yarrowia lipolytica CLIB122]